MPFGDLELHGPFVIFPLMYIEVVLGLVEWLIIDCRGARDDFMVHDVNNPIS